MHASEVYKTSQQVIIGFKNLPAGYYRDLCQSMCSYGRLAIETSIKKIELTSSTILCWCWGITTCNGSYHKFVIRFQRYRFNLAPTPSPSRKLITTNYIHMYTCVLKRSTTYMTSLHSLLMKLKVLLLGVSRLKANHCACAVSTFASQFAGQCRLPVDLHPRLEQTDIWLVQFCAWSSAKVTNVSASWHLGNKLWQVRFWPLPFVHAETWSSATRAMILKRWTLFTILSMK